MKLLLSAILSLFTFGAFAQLSLNATKQDHEIGALFGASNYHGDLADEVVFAETHPSFGIFYRRNMNEYLSLRSTFSVLTISGSDTNFEEYRLRNLSFQSNILELSNIAEFNFQPFSSYPFHKNSTFYAFAGLAVMYHNPKAEMNGSWHNLHPLNTEGQAPKERYNRIQLTIPFGGGVKVQLTPNLIASWELGWRKTFTDYLDDVSTTYPETATNLQFSDRSWEIADAGQNVNEPGDMRGDPSFKDWYIQTGITIAYRFTPIICWKN